MIVKLTTKQFDYLIYSFAEEQDALRFKLMQNRKDNQLVVMEVDEDVADEIRDWASNELQKKGFDIDYELTDEGEILEELIDIFYIG